MCEEQKRQEEREMMKKNCRKMASDLGVFVVYSEVAREVMSENLREVEDEQ